MQAVLLLLAVLLSRVLGAELVAVAWDMVVAAEQGDIAVLAGTAHP